MPFDTQQLLKETAQSPHAAQLNRGFAWLRFRAPLEHDYLQHMREAMDAQYLIAAFMGIFAWSLFTFVDMLRFDVWNTFPHLSTLAIQVLALRLSSMLALVAALFALRVQRLRRFRPLIAAAVLLIMSLAGAVMIALCKQAGLPQGDSALLLMIVCCFLPLGLTFYQSLGLAR